MNFIWPLLIIVSYIFSFITGNMNNLNNSIYSSITEAINLSITLLGNMCLWCGIMNIVKSTKLIIMLKKVLRPFLNWLYPYEKKNKEIMNNISINMISNMLGIGNAATPAGIKAIQGMQMTNSNKDRISKSMTTLIILNTASVQIIPTTVIAIRASLKSNNPAEIVFPIWISTFSGAVAAILLTKIIDRIKGVD